MAIFLRGIVGVMVVFLFAACGSTEKTGNGDGEISSEGDDPPISNKKINQTVTQNLAPGTAKVHIELQSTGQDAPPDVWPSVVKEVLGYGSATPPLSVGTELAIQTKGYFSNVSTDPAEVMVREKIIFIIQHQENPGSAATPTWRLVGIVDQSKK